MRCLCVSRPRHRVPRGAARAAFCRGSVAGVLAGAVARGPSRKEVWLCPARCYTLLLSTLPGK